MYYHKEMKKKGKKLNELKKDIKTIVDDSVSPREKRQVRESFEFFRRAKRVMEEK